jgi:hypothetical protein
MIGFNIVNNSIDEIVNWDAEFCETKDTSSLSAAAPGSMKRILIPHFRFVKPLPESILVSFWCVACGSVRSYDTPLPLRR